jgi:hypothetical protein
MRRSIRIRIRAPRRLPLFANLGFCALALAVLGLMAWETRAVQASDQPTPIEYPMPRRRFYLSKELVPGGEAMDACAPGYHFASLWEILDTSGLEYDTVLGFKQDDSGGGIPTFYGAWIRTGYSSSTAMIAGQANCAAWSDSSNLSYGSGAYNHRSWTYPTVHDLHTWKVYPVSCNQWLRVWCVQDHVGFVQFLPLVMKD